MPLISVQLHPACLRSLRAPPIKKNPFHDEKDCKDHRDYGDTGRDANEEGEPRCDADECENRFQGTMGDLLAEKGHEEGDYTANQGKCSRNCAITTEKIRGEPMPRKPTKSERMPPTISQPRLIERASRAVAGETLDVIERNLQAIREEKGEQFLFFGISAHASKSGGGNSVGERPSLCPAFQLKSRQ